MAAVSEESEVNGVAMGQSRNFCTDHVHGGNDHNHVAAHGGNVQVDGGAHQLGHVDLAFEASLLQGDVLGMDAQNDILFDNVILSHQN